ncbi:hypothetical protein KUTeg_022827, partial [Tegillarca granosa]
MVRIRSSKEMMVGFTPYLFLLFSLINVLQYCEGVTPGTCADLIYLKFDQTVEHGYIRTVTGNNKTGMVLRETISSADNNTYFAYVSAICKLGNVYKYNCLALKKFLTSNSSDYTELGQRNSEYCFENEVRINADCRMASMRIINGALICELEPSGSSTYTRIAKIDIATGQVIKTRDITDSKQTTLCLKTREKEWNPSANAHLGDVTIHILVDGTETWLLYESASQSTKSIVEQINDSDLSTIDTKVVDKIDRRNLVLLICGKLYVLDVSSSEKSISITKAVDIYNTVNVMNHRVRIVDGFSSNAFVNWIHYNPRLEEVFIGALDSNTFTYKVVKCDGNYPDTRNMNLTQLKSTMLWSLEANLPDHITDMVDTLVSYFKSRNVTEMNYLSKNLLVCPPKTCAHDISKPTSQYCRIKFAITTFKIYTDYKHFGSKSTKMLQVYFHLDSLLDQQNFQYMSTQIYYLREFLSKNFMELKLKVNEYRDTIGSYFTTLSNYDEDISNSDMNLIYSYLDRFKNQSEELTQWLNSKMSVLFEEAEASAGAEIVGKANIVIGASLAFANPLTGLKAAGPIQALDNAIDGLALATSTLTKVLSLKKHLPEMKTMVTKMLAKIKENDEKYGALKTLVGDAYNKTLTDAKLTTLSSKFLDEYDTYRPGYLPSSIARIEAIYNEMVEEICDAVYAGSTMPSAIAQAVFYDRGNCFDAKLKVKSLMAVYYDMYDNQGNFLDALRSLVRAQISKHNANRIKKIQNEINTNQLVWTHVNLKVYTMELFISSEVHRLVQVHEACNLIKYKNADVMPDFCKKTIIYTHHVDYAKVAAYRYTDDMCGSDFIERYVKVPAKEQLHNVNLPNGTIDLISLYEGKEVNFKIPDRQWLIDNGWIRSSDNPAMILLKRFELFLPMLQNTSTTTPVTVKSYLKLAGSNRISAGVYARYYLSTHVDGNIVQPRPQ